MQKTHLNDWQYIYHSQILSIALGGWGHWLLEALSSSWSLVHIALGFLRRHAIDVQLFSHSSQRSLVGISLCQNWGTKKGFLPFLSSLFQKEEFKFTFPSKIFHILFSRILHLSHNPSNSSTVVLWAFSGTHFSWHGEMPTCALPVITFFVFKVWSSSLWCLPHALQLPALLVNLFF